MSKKKQIFMKMNRIHFLYTCLERRLNMLNISDINISYSNKHIFKNAYVKFYNGNIHAVIGASGSGKTTLIKTILTSQSQINYNEEIVMNKEEFILNHVFYVDQNGSYFENMNIFQHFQFYGELKNKKVEKSIIYKYLQKVGIDKVNLKHSPSQLSIGERKRFLIALALFSQKDIIILDEPTASLDYQSIVRLKKVLSELKDKTIILTTHEGELLEICDVIYEIKDYQIVMKEQHLKNESELVNKQNNHFKPLQYLKYKNKFQWLQQMFLIVIGVFLCIQLGVVFNNEYTLYSGLSGNQYLAEDSMIYFRKRQLYAPHEMYVSGEEWNSIPLEDKEKEAIENISGVLSIYNIGQFSVINPNNTTEAKSVKIISNEQEHIIDENIVIAERPVVKPYFPENNMDKDNKKIFISSQFATEQNIQSGDTVELPLHIPTYQYIYNNESQIYRYISYKQIDMKFDIDEAIDVSKNYKSFDTPYIIYIPYQQYEAILNQYNGDSSGSKPRAENVTAMTYSYDDYVIFAERDKIADVYKDLTELNEDYDVFSQSVFYTEGAQEQFEFQESRVMIIGGIGLLSAIVYAVIFYFQLRSKRRERRQLVYNGVNHSYIRKYLSIETFIHGFSWISLSLLTVVVLGTHYLLLNMIIFMITAIILSLMEQAILYYVLRREKNNLC